MSSQNTLPIMPSKRNTQPNGVWYAPTPDYEWPVLGESKLELYTSWLVGSITVWTQEFSINDYKPCFYVVPGIEGVFNDQRLRIMNPGGGYEHKIVTLHLPLTAAEVLHVTNSMGASHLCLEVRNWMQDGSCYLEFFDQAFRRKQANRRAFARIESLDTFTSPERYQVLHVED